MSDAAALATARPMGRPPIGKPTPVRLPPEMLEQVDARVGTYGRAAFIREAVAEKLERENWLDTATGTLGESGG